MFECRTVQFMNNGNIIGTENQYRTRTLMLSLGVLVWGSWTTWIPFDTVTQNV
jgi:hypothetical protein